jgi:alginate O-acetyltransferase complex protein AlgI
MDEQTVLAYWIAAIAFTLQIYFDFSGYSDMAIGLGRVFGFRFLENFNYPYIARTVSEFWHRWHISLGSWFRDYVYIPLGGNRVNLSKWIRNVIIVWFLTGFWHGAEWNFIIWGIYFAFFLVLEKYVLRRLLARAPSIFSHVYLLTVVVFGFVIFNANGLTPALEALKGMTGATRLSFSSHETMYYLKSYGFVIIFAAMAATPLMSNLLGKLTNCKTGRSIGNILQPALIVIILLLVTGYLVDGSFNPFIYFRF